MNGKTVSERVVYFAESKVGKRVWAKKINEIAPSDKGQCISVLQTLKRGGTVRNRRFDTEKERAIYCGYGMGQCWDLAWEALRLAGAKKPVPLYAWSTKLRSSLRDAKPGDILQFRKFKVTKKVTAYEVYEANQPFYWTFGKLKKNAVKKIGNDKKLVYIVTHKHSSSWVVYNIPNDHTAILGSILPEKAWDKEQGQFLIYQQHVRNTSEVRKDIEYLMAGSYKIAKRRKKIDTNSSNLGIKAYESLDISISVSGDLKIYQPEGPPTRRQNQPIKNRSVIKR